MTQLTTEPYFDKRRFYTQTLMRDARWKGTPLGIALLYGIQTAMAGNGRMLHVTRNAGAFGVRTYFALQVALALSEQGYLVFPEGIAPATGVPYEIDGQRPAAEIDAAEPGVEIPGWTPEPGTASWWLREEKRAWGVFHGGRADLWNAA